MGTAWSSDPGRMRMARRPCSPVSLPIQAFLMGLLDAAALHRIAKTAQTDFVRIWGRYGGRTAGETDLGGREVLTC